MNGKIVIENCIDICINFDLIYIDAVKYNVCKK